jgi:large subunit ribosomal protein L9
MKIILTSEVAGLGAPGDVVEVKDGYARNYLLPRGVAIRWTKGGEKDVEQIRRARKIHEIATIEQANEVKSRLEGTKIRLRVRAGTGGRAGPTPSGFDPIYPQAGHAALQGGWFEPLSLMLLAPSAFFMLGGLSLGSFGLALSCSADFLQKAGKQDEHGESVWTERLRWIGFSFTTIGVGLSIYSGYM